MNSVDHHSPVITPGRDKSRSDILTRIRTATRKNPLHDNDKAEQRLSHPTAGIIPARGNLGAEGQIKLFCEEASKVNASLARIAKRSDIPAEIGRFLGEKNLPSTIKLAPDPAVSELDWSSQPLLETSIGPAAPSDSASISHAFAGVAETGTLMFLSGPHNPTTLNYLPPTHIALVQAADICGNYEQVWTRLRAESDALGQEFMPRTVSMITGPSRTADIDQTLLLGIHGPLHLHIVIIDEEKQ